MLVIIQVERWLCSLPKRMIYIIKSLSGVLSEYLINPIQPCKC